MKAAWAKKHRKSWREKRDAPPVDYPKLVDIPQKWAQTIGHGKMVILTPKIVDQYMRTIPQGKLVTINLIRQKFAADFDVDMTCPMTTGIFVWICAWAAEDEKAAGKNNITPYWRVLHEGGKLNPKYPGGVQRQAFYLKKEGFTILEGKSGKSLYVKDYQKYLVKV